MFLIPQTPQPPKASELGCVLSVLSKFDTVVCFCPVSLSVD